MDDLRIKAVSSLLSSYFDEDKLRRGMGYAAFFGGWKHIAGERLSAHSRVADIDRGILVIETEHPGWIQLLQMKQAELLAAAREKYPEMELRGIVFRLGRASDPRGPAEPAPDTRVRETGQVVGPEGSREESQEPREILDPEMKALLERVKKVVDEGK
jgi:hypothetical protein